MINMRVAALPMHAQSEKMTSSCKDIDENLKIALKFSNDALAAERQQKLSDRKTFEAKVKSMEDDYENTFKMLQIPLSLTRRDQYHQTLFEKLQQKATLLGWVQIQKILRILFLSWDYM